ncbi:MAG: hypothetical protein RI953_1160 [Pseudomonadota bacterium]|jgi:hypothetical protein
MELICLQRMAAFWICSASISLSASGAELTRLDETLNFILMAADLNEGNAMSVEDCRRLDALASSKSKGATSRFTIVANKIHAERCARSPENDPQNPYTTKSPLDETWDGKPNCRQSDQRTITCSHNPVTGRGLFAYSGSSTPTNSPTLVCAHHETSSQSPLDMTQEINSRCVLTEFDWRYEGSRSDVFGMHNWLNSSKGAAALSMPGWLKDQCSNSFPDALYCTPTLIVLPESDPASLSICALKTRDYRFGLGPILRISSSNSHWQCESKSLLVPDKDQRLTVEERSCVPDELGRVMNEYCRLPYMPVARKPLRTFIP